MNHDGHDDLAIGMPGMLGWDSEDLGKPGAVVLLYGGETGLTAMGAMRITQDASGVPGTAEQGDEFGATLAIANYGKSASEDLVVGVPGESLGAIERAGSVDVLWGRLAGLSGTSAQAWSQDSPGIRGSAEPYDYFGVVLGD